ncbi:cytochrome P450 [Brevibacillus fulvus]|uniref:Cytochrome P450 n=1 Tax=Brevibacillus fulvus TaxID=1125967 RepID=A0A938XW41_9BACL|nr:cytochrome P450 [Brevibacillus fulvus]MBM7589016.1 cytochrome P450 [Brevibacillus fulvus]
MVTEGKDRYANIIPIAELDSAEKRIHPFPVYNRLRQTTPVRYDETRSCWDVFRYDDVHAVLKDPAAFSSRRALAVREKETILTMDPPRHNQMRSLVNKAFTPKVVNDLGPRIAAITDELLDSVLSQGRMDIVHDFAVPLPVIVIAELLGVPPEDRHLFKEWSDVLVKGPEQNTDEEFRQVIDEKIKATDELTAYFTKIISQRRTETAEDLISILLRSEIEGQKLSDEEVISFSILLLAAGNETTTNLITNGVRRLTEDPQLQQRLSQTPEDIPAFIEEVLRYYPPVQAIGRVATRDIEIGGQRIKAGDQVVSWVASANRDETKFDNPDQFILERKPNSHLSFGFGIHFCLGAPLARLEGQIAIRKMMERMKEIQLQSGIQLTPIPSPFVYGVKEFPVSFRTLQFA